MDELSPLSTHVISARIIGCGHRHFLAKKSGLTFPSFLIQFAEKDRTRTTGDSKTYDDSVQYRYSWRSKRDFLLLKRSNSLKSTDFPKSSFSNLCEQASINPWVRPLNCKDFQAESFNIIQTLGIQEIDAAQSGYHPRMKKSIMRIDSFLRNYSDSEGFIIFCRHGDSEGIITKESSATEEVSYELQDKVGIIKHAAKLSQYFTCRRDADMHLFIPTVMPMISTGTREWSPIVFIEPSCGDGRILDQLVCNLASPTHAGQQSHLVLAYDIDDKLILQCKRKYKSNSKIFVSVQCSNFLELTKEDVRSSIAQIRGTSDGISLVFMGNPPYSSGTGSGSEICRHLPWQFIIHSIVNIGANYVSYILPQRCNKDIERMIIVLEKETNSKWLCDSHDLEESMFSFEGDFVKQPSILQCWYKKSELI